MSSVAVVIPTRNRRELVGRAIRSALQQTQPPEQVVVVDDASTDGTAVAVAGIDPRVLSIRLERRAGMAAARNAGAARVAAEWIAFLDDDDLWAPEKLEAQLATVRYTDSCWVFGAALVVDVKAAKVYVAGRMPPEIRVEADLIARNDIPAGASNVVMRTSMFRRLGGFDSTFEHLADWDLWLRATAEMPAAVCPRIVTAYIRHSGSILFVDRSDVPAEFGRLTAKHSDRARRLGVAFDPVAFSHWVAEGQLLGGRPGDAFRTHVRAALRHRDIGHALSAPRVWLGPGAMGLRTPRPVAVDPPAWITDQLGAGRFAQ